MASLIYLARVSIAHAQMRELNALQAQLQQQHDAQRIQALLADALFQTDRRAQQLTVVAEQDPLVAAIFAEQWLSSLRHVTPDSFFQVEHKKGWAAAVSRLQSIHSLLVRDASARDLANRVQWANEQGERLNAAIGGDAERRVADLAQAHDAASHQVSLGLKITAGSAAALFGVPTLCVIIGVIVAAASDKRAGEDAAGTFTCLGTFGGVCAMIALVYGFSVWLGSREKARKALSDRQELDKALSDLRAFAADPRGGQLLDAFFRDHPAYMRPLPNVDHLGPTSAVERQVVERQTVVARCRYCRALTPVDAPTCQYCGAGGFA